MKTSNLGVAGVLSCAIIFGSCQDKQFEERTYTANVPVYQNDAELLTQVKSTEAKGIDSKGKIFLKDDYIFINEPNVGIHIIDNSDPVSPNNICFVSIPGNVDMAGKDNILYADSYQDLLVIDISDVTNVQVLERIENIYPGALPPLADPRLPMAQIDEEQGTVIGWTVEEITERVESGSQNRGPFFGGVIMEDAAGRASTNNSFGGGSVSIAGSMARMTLTDNHLYTVGNGNLSCFDITDRKNPVRGNDLSVSWNIETLFPFSEYMLIGTTTGMLIYGLNNPMAPEYLSTFWHATSCDPVVAEGNTAYVTLRGGRPCGGFDNQLDLIDISDIMNPTLIQSYPMTGPYGLGIDNGTLFLCDGDNGLKVYDVTDPDKVDQNLLASHHGINTYDVIPHNNRLILIGDDGLYQYDYSDVNSLHLLSVIHAN